MDINVYDDFFPPEICDGLAALCRTPNLTYGSRSAKGTDPHGHWVQEYVIGGDTSALTDLLAAAWEFIRDTRLPDDVLIRCYLNGYTYGTEGYFHTDSDNPSSHTTIIYVNDTWDPDWAGETVFLEGSDIAKAVLPRRNRAVIFPSNMLHAARSVSRKCVALRKVLIFKSYPPGSNVDATQQQ